MGTKLTLRLEDILIKNAKRAARSRGVSLSKMVADYFKTISSQQKKEAPESPVLSEISGILPPRTDEKKLLKSYKKHLAEKYR
jgi:hypothetical protein